MMDKQGVISEMEKHYREQLELYDTELAELKPSEFDSVEPDHYHNGEMDRIDVWYETFPFEGFRWAMKSHIDKYVYRYELKGKLKDLKKAIVFIERLIEKEKLHASKRDSSDNHPTD